MEHIKKYLWIYVIMAIILFFAGMYVITYGWPSIDEIKSALLGDISRVSMPK